MRRCASVIGAAASTTATGADGRRVAAASMRPQPAPAAASSDVIAISEPCSAPAASAARPDASPRITPSDRRGTSTSTMRGTLRGAGCACALTEPVPANGLKRRLHRTARRERIRSRHRVRRERPRHVAAASAAPPTSASGPASVAPAAQRYGSVRPSARRAMRHAAGPVGRSSPDCNVGSAVEAEVGRHRLARHRDQLRAALAACAARSTARGAGRTARACSGRAPPPTAPSCVRTATASIASSSSSAVWYRSRRILREQPHARARRARAAYPARATTAAAPAR